MVPEEKKYDIVVSLGGNCSVAANLKQRGMRHFSLPFDWVFMEDARPVHYLIQGFPNRFRDFFVRENLERIPGNLHHPIIVADKLTGYRFPNHFFHDPILEEDYTRVQSKLQRRIDRLYTLTQAADRALFILTIAFPISDETIIDLQKAIAKTFPTTSVDLRVMKFLPSGGADKCRTCGNVTVYDANRPFNDYDFFSTNWDWHFMDLLTLKRTKTKRKRLLSVRLFGRQFQLVLEKTKNV